MVTITLTRDQLESLISQMEPRDLSVVNHRLIMREGVNSLAYVIGGIGSPQWAWRTQELSKLNEEYLMELFNLVNTN